MHRFLGNSQEHFKNILFFYVKANVIKSTENGNMRYIMPLIEVCHRTELHGTPRH